MLLLLILALDSSKNLLYIKGINYISFIEEEMEINTKLLSYNIKVRPYVSNKTRSMSHKNKKALNCVCSNLVACLRKGQTLVYSRDKYKSSKGLSVAQIISAIDFLVLEGLVENVVGVQSFFKDFRNPSMIKPTEALVRLFEPLLDKSLPTTLPRDENLYNSSVGTVEIDYLNSVDVIELRNSNKKAIDFTLTSEIKEMQKVIRKLNEVNSKHTFMCKERGEMTNIYTRIFSREDFGLGGRWYRAGILEVKNKESRARLDVTIDGEAVVEVDFSCLHFRTVAAMFGVPEELVPLDLYTEPLKRLLQTGEDWSEYDNSVDRNIIKLAVNILFNSRSLRSAAGAISETLRCLPPQDREKSRLGGSQDVIELLAECYPEFVPYFRGEIENLGLILQRADSNIVERVVREFISHNKPILPVHDSFLCKADDLDLLLEAMGRGFRDELGVDFIVPVVVEYKLDGKVERSQVLL